MNDIVKKIINIVLGVVGFALIILGKFIKFPNAKPLIAQYAGIFIILLGFAMIIVSLYLYNRRYK